MSSLADFFALPARHCRTARSSDHPIKCLVDFSPGRLHEQLQLFYREFRLTGKQSSNVPSRVRQTFDVAAGDGIVIEGQYYDRQAGIRRKRCPQGYFRSDGDNDIGLCSDKLSRCGNGAVHALIDAAMIDLK